MQVVGDEGTGGTVVRITVHAEPRGRVGHIRVKEAAPVGGLGPARRTPGGRSDGACSEQSPEKVRAVQVTT